MAEDMLLIMRGGRGLATRGGRGGRGGRSSALHATPGPRRPKYSIDEARDAEDNEQQAADQTVVSEVHKKNRKSAVRQARAAEKSGSEYTVAGVSTCWLLHGLLQDPGTEGSYKIRACSSGTWAISSVLSGWAVTKIEGL